MFVMNPYLRFGLIALGFVAGGLLWYFAGVWYGIWFILIALFLLAAYFFMGTVAPAAKAMQDKGPEVAEKYLNMTLFPNWLYKPNRTYYYMIKGSIAMGRQDYEEAEKWLKVSSDIGGAASDNERALLQIQLAGLAIQRQKWQQAKLYYRNAKEFKITEPAIKDQLKQLEMALNNQGMQSAAMRMGKQGHGMMRTIGGSGGKRKGPRTR